MVAFINDKVSSFQWGLTSFKCFGVFDIFWNVHKLIPQSAVATLPLVYLFHHNKIHFEECSSQLLITSAVFANIFNFTSEKHLVESIDNIYLTLLLRNSKTFFLKNIPLHFVLSVQGLVWKSCWQETPVKVLSVSTTVLNLKLKAWWMCMQMIY